MLINDRIDIFNKSNASKKSLFLDKGFKLKPYV